MVRHLLPELMRLAAGWRGTDLTQEVISWWLGVPQSTDRKIFKRHRETGQFVQRRCSGQPRISTPREDRVLTRMCQANHFLSATMLKSIWMRTIKRRCSIQTVWGRLLAAGLQGHHPKKETSPDPTKLGWGASQLAAWSLASCRVHWRVEVYSLHVWWKNTGV